MMGLLSWLRFWMPGKSLPLHLRHGIIGERAAKKHLKKLGLKFLTANFRTENGEIDLIMREEECLVFVEVKTRSSEDWTRPADAVDAERKRRLSLCGLDYLRLLRNPRIKFRFDIVEVLLDGETVGTIRHIPNAFPLAQPFRYGELR